MQYFHKIFNKAIGKIYLIVACLGIILGLVITLTCVDVYHKLTHSIMKANDGTHVIINKQVSLMNTLSLSDNSFTKENIEDLKKQDFVQDVGEITASSCRIWAFRDSEPLKFKTDIFFESLDDRFLDKKPREWRWSKEDDFVPVMVNADFLNLYNFAFAKTQNLPQFTSSTIGKFTVLLEVYGNGQKRLFKTRIVEVSDRIPSLIVPQTFLKHINQVYGKPDEGKYSRVLLKVDNPSNPKLIEYLRSNDIVANEDLLSSGKSKTILAQALGIELGLALILLLLAAIIVIIAFELLISNARADMQLLKQLGFHSKQLMRYFIKKFHLLFLIQITVSFLIISYLSYIFKTYLVQMEYEDIEWYNTPTLLVFGIIAGVYYLFFKWRIGFIIKKSL